TTKDMRGPRRPRTTIGLFIRLLRKGPFAPIDPAVWAEVRTVQIVGAASQRLAVEPDFALFRHSIVVAVGQLPDLRRRGDVDRPLVIHHPLGKHHAIGKYTAFVEPPVTIGVAQAQNTMRPLF